MNDEEHQMAYELYCSGCGAALWRRNTPWFIGERLTFEGVFHAVTGKPAKSGCVINWCGCTALFLQRPTLSETA